jgi:hypothetical protein
MKASYSFLNLLPSSYIDKSRLNNKDVRKISDIFIMMIGPNSCASESVREEDNGNMEEDNNQPMA